MTKAILLLLVCFLIICAIAVSFTKNLLGSVIIFMSYSLVMSIVWIFLESPDLAITEAAVGAGITSVLFFVTLRKIDAVEEEPEDAAAESSEDAEAAVTSENPSEASTKSQKPSEDVSGGEV